MARWLRFWSSPTHQLIVSILNMDTSRGSFDSVEEEQEMQTFDHFDIVL
jgi:hypothetical protein